MSLAFKSWFAKLLQEGYTQKEIGLDKNTVTKFVVLLVQSLLLWPISRFRPCTQLIPSRLDGMLSVATTITMVTVRLRLPTPKSPVGGTSPTITIHRWVASSSTQCSDSWNDEMFPLRLVRNILLFWPDALVPLRVNIGKMSFLPSEVQEENLWEFGLITYSYHN